MIKAHKISSDEYMILDIEKRQEIFEEMLEMYNIGGFSKGDSNIYYNPSMQTAWMLFDLQMIRSDYV